VVSNRSARRKWDFVLLPNGNPKSAVRARWQLNGDKIVLTDFDDVSEFTRHYLYSDLVMDRDLTNGQITLRSASDGVIFAKHAKVTSRPVGDAR
jgi:hypothetical protein